MGAQVERVSRRAQVAGATSEPAEEFGRWFQKQRELRGISIWFVAARTKLSPERMREIESGRGPLGRDGHGRGTARALARAIGADPAEAAARLACRSTGPEGRRRARWRGALPPLRSAVGIVLGLGLGVWLLALWLRSAETPEDSPSRVYRPDYVERLLSGEGS